MARSWTRSSTVATATATGGTAQRSDMAPTLPGVVSGEALEPVGLLEQPVEVDQVVVGERLAGVGLEQLGGRVPVLEAHAGGDEEVDDAGLGGLHDRHPAGRAAEHVGAQLVHAADAHAQVAHAELDVSAVLAARLDDRRHGDRPTLRGLSMFLVWSSTTPGPALSDVCHNEPSCPPGSPPSAARRSASPTEAPGPTPRRTRSRPSA